MDIYEGEGVDAILDLRKAADELRRTDGMIEARRKQTVAEITAAALLDIAYSLRPVGIEAAVALRADFLDTTPEDGEQADEVSDVIVEGDLVAVSGHDEPAEVLSLGFTEGATTVTVRFSSGAEARFWLSDVHRLVGDERDDDTMQKASGDPVVTVHTFEEADAAGNVRTVTAELTENADGSGSVHEINPADLVDEIDADFDGAESPEAASALDLLKANEAARKAAKKGKKK